MIDIFAVGSKVSYKSNPELDVVVLQVNLSDGQTRYEVAHWNENNRVTEWVYEFELIAKSETKLQKIGFL